MENEKNIIPLSVKRTAESAPIASELVKPIERAITNAGVIFLYNQVADRPISRFIMPVLGPAYGQAMGYTRKEYGN